MSYTIKQMGNEHTNQSSRAGNTPIVIVDHISAGSMGSMDNWFRSSGNTVSSAHFGVSKKGEIHQYVSIEKKAWAQGLKIPTIKNAKAPIIREHKKTNPNDYCIGIEHEGFDGELTEAQFQATVWLHKYIQAEVLRIYGHKIELNERYVLGHFQVDPVRKPFCPGPKFPWARLYSALKSPLSAPVVSKPAAPAPAPKPAAPATPTYPTAEIRWNGRMLSSQAISKDGKTYVPARVLGELAGFTVGYKNGNVTIGGKPIADTITIGTVGFVRSTDFGAVVGYNVTWKGGILYLQKKTVK